MFRKYSFLYQILVNFFINFLLIKCFILGPKSPKITNTAMVIFCILVKILMLTTVLCLDGEHDVIGLVPNKDRVPDLKLNGEYRPSKESTGLLPTKRKDLGGPQ